MGKQELARNFIMAAALVVGFAGISGAQDRSGYIVIGTRSAAASDTNQGQLGSGNAAISDGGYAGPGTMSATEDSGGETFIEYVLDLFFQ